MSLHLLPGNAARRASVGAWHGEQLTLDVVGLEGVGSEPAGAVPAVHQAFGASVDLEEEEISYGPKQTIFVNIKGKI